MKHYTISQAAAHSGLSAKMIRDYEAKGLLPAAIRNDAGYRLYQERDLHTLLFIARARELGFSLKQLEALLALWQDTARSSSQVKQLAESHIAELEEKAKQLHEKTAYLLFREINRSMGQTKKQGSGCYQPKAEQTRSLI